MRKFDYASVLLKIRPRLGIFIFLIVVLPLLFLAQYIHPNNMDMFYTMNAFNDKSRLELLSSLRNYPIGSRYTTVVHIIFGVILNGKGDVNNYQNIAVLLRINGCCVILFFFFSLYSLLNTINRIFLKLSLSDYFLLFSSVSLLIVSGLQRMDLFFYEIVMTQGYTLGFSFSLIFVASLIYYVFSENGRRVNIPLLIVWAISLFWLSGSIEYYVVLAGYFCFLCILFSIIRFRRFDIPCFIMLLWFFIVFILFACASGQKEKAIGYGGQVDNFYSLYRIGIWMRSYIDVLIEAFCSVWNFQTFCVVLLLSLFIAKRVRFNDVSLFSFVFVGNILLSVIMSFFLFVVGQLTFECLPNVIQIPYVILRMNFILFWITIINFAYQHMSISFPIAKKSVFFDVRYFLFFVSIFSVSLSRNNVRTAWLDLIRGSAKEYSDSVYRLVDGIKKCDDDVVYVKEIPNSCHSLAKNNLLINIWNSEYGHYDGYREGVAPFFHKENIIIEEAK